MNNYTFYKITSHLGNKVYVGKTKKELATRFSQHVYNYNLYNRNRSVNFTSSFTIFAEYGVENCKIEVLTTLLCNTKEQASMLEGLFILNFKNNAEYACINKNIAGRTQQEYRRCNILKINGKHECRCGGKYTYQGFGQHCKTLKHIEFTNLMQPV